MPYWKCEILPALAHHDAILVVAHGNSLRGIIKHLKGISDEAISEFNLPTAVPYVFEFDEGLNYAGDHFLGDPDEIARADGSRRQSGEKVLRRSGRPPDAVRVVPLWKLLPAGWHPV